MTFTRTLSRTLTLPAVTLATLLSLSACTPAERTVAVAVSEIGASELDPRPYMRYPADPIRLSFWCDEFVEHVLITAKVPLPTRTGSPRDFAIGYKPVEPAHILPGDLAFISLGAGPFDHMGIVASIDPDPAFLWVVEGNVKAPGFTVPGVAHTRYPITAITRFTRPSLGPIR